MSRRDWKLNGWEAAFGKWKNPPDPNQQRPDVTLVGIVDGWADLVRRKGLPQETVMTDDGDFVVRVLGTQTIIAGVVQDFTAEEITVHSISGV